ncbi:PAS domain-containing protein [Shinella pollutisoli]|uniref:PAS domain-containing protein n=1 Tax=Shinella pollutisoli TaxID=2250594 RepID=A0ABV7DFG5_9HYPH
MKTPDDATSSSQGEDRRRSAGVAAAAESEVPFGVDELFFSRTEARGRILAGNSVFQRVSRYSWAEMTGQPHNIIRHPDMPRAVFFVLWERIRAGHPVGAYVKNRAKDGGYYWVFAVVTPVEDGYLSVRLKPGSALFAAASGLYAAVRRHEGASAAKPAESAGVLMDGLAAAGFRDYAAFMAAALSREMGAREAALGRSPWPALGLFDELVAAADILLTTTGRMLGMISTFSFTPGNLRIQASRLGDEGRAIAEISSNYARISDAIVRNLEDLGASAKEVFSVVNEGLFLTCVAKLQAEMASLFDREISDGDRALKDEAQRLVRQTEEYKAHAARKFELIKQRIGHFFELTADMKRLLSGLVAVRVMGKVESVNMSSGIFFDLIADLERGHAGLASGLEEIGRLNDRISENVRQLDTVA